MSASVAAVLGLIPACAGSTTRQRAGGAAGGAHPRMRGEHPGTIRAGLCPGGSSPHARGALGFRPDMLKQYGLIPACAGSTPTRIATNSTTWAHPRMRGEHVPYASASPLTPGSSPHARGAQKLPEVGEVTDRLIPACAGSTDLRATRDAMREAHPRMRGEHIFVGEPPLPGLGSSPHARGARSCSAPPYGS